MESNPNAHPDRGMLLCREKQCSTDTAWADRENTAVCASGSDQGPHATVPLTQKPRIGSSIEGRQQIRTDSKWTGGSRGQVWNGERLLTSTGCLFGVMEILKKLDDGDD